VINSDLSVSSFRISSGMKTWSCNPFTWSCNPLCAPVVDTRGSSFWSGCSLRNAWGPPGLAILKISWRRCTGFAHLVLLFNTTPLNVVPQTTACNGPEQTLLCFRLWSQFALGFVLRKISSFAKLFFVKTHRSWNGITVYTAK